jgi:SPP1 family predicted phage head-tail adaptor
VDIQRNTPVQDTDGGEVASWTTVARIPAKVAELRGREFIEAQEKQSEITTRIRIRFRSDIGVDWRILHGSTVYEVLHVIDLDGRRRELDLMCRSVRPDHRTSVVSS